MHKTCIQWAFLSHDTCCLLYIYNQLKMQKLTTILYKSKWKNTFFLGRHWVFFLLKKKCVSQSYVEGYSPNSRGSGGVVECQRWTKRRQAETASNKWWFSPMAYFKQFIKPMCLFAFSRRTWPKRERELSCIKSLKCEAKNNHKNV